MHARTDIDEAKRALRTAAAARRRDIAAADDGSAGGRLAALFLEAVTVPERVPVSGFWPIRTEIDVMPLLRGLSARGHPVALPVVAGPGRPLTFREWREGDAMEVGPYGISEPLATAPELTPHVLLVPLLAFDRNGYRLGYGGGFYDRSLAELRIAGTAVAVGAGWAAQEVPAVPHDANDRRLDWVVTEREAIRIPGDAP